MTDFRVDLDMYNGPMDLLLYLIRRDEIDIYDIPVAGITEQYLEYVNLIKQLDIDLAGEFLVMATTLMEIKSVMLLPREEIDGQSGDDISDPRLELVRQLLEYKKFKDAAGDLAESAQFQAMRHPRPLADLQRLREELKSEQEIDMENVQIWDLFDAFNRLMQATLAGKRSHEVIHDDTPIDIYESYILAQAQRENPLKFEAVFGDLNNYSEMIGMFLALLELMRNNLIYIEQEKTFGTIYVFAKTEESADKAVARAISADIESLPGKKVAKEHEQDDTVSQETEDKQDEQNETLDKGQADEHTEET